MSSQGQGARASPAQMLRDDVQRVAAMFQAGHLPGGQLVGSGGEQRQSRSQWNEAAETFGRHRGAANPGAQGVSDYSKAKPDSEIAGRKQKG